MFLFKFGESKALLEPPISFAEFAWAHGVVSTRLIWFHPLKAQSNAHFEDFHDTTSIETNDNSIHNKPINGGVENHDDPQLASNESFMAHLVPLTDLVNSRQLSNASAVHRTLRDKSGMWCETHAREDFAKGEEVFENYGKPNWWLWMVS